MESEEQAVEKTVAAPLIRISKMTFGVIALVLVVVIIVAVFITQRSTRVSLNDYMKIDFYGYDTKGTATATFDMEAFSRDYGDKIKDQNISPETLMNGASVCEQFKDACISGSLIMDQNLSNGDVISYVWSCDEERAKAEYKVELDFKNIDFTVSGLEEVVTVDPFEGVEVIFSGLDPQGEAHAVNNAQKEYLKDLYFTIEPSNNLRNGQTVSVVMENNWNSDYYLDQYGILFSQTEKEVTVEGLGAYVDSLSVISDNILSQMKRQCEDDMAANSSRNWSEHASFDGMEYLGSYFLKAKDPGRTSSQNVLYLVYQIQASNHYEEEEVHSSFAYYTTYKFTDLIVLPDGTVSVDLSAYSACNDSFTREVQYGERSWDYSRFTYKGYEDLTTAFKRNVTAYVDTYQYESNVEDVHSEPEEESEE